MCPRLFSVRSPRCGPASRREPLRFRESPGDRRAADAEHIGSRRESALLANCENDPKVVPGKLAAGSIQGIAPLSSLRRRRAYLESGRTSGAWPESLMKTASTFAGLVLLALREIRWWAPGAS
jgi:hypothetical protein